MKMTCLNNSPYPRTIPSITLGHDGDPLAHEINGNMQGLHVVLQPLVIFYNATTSYFEIGKGKYLSTAVRIKQ